MMAEYEINSIEELRGRDYWDTLNAANSLSMSGMNVIEISSELEVAPSVVVELLG